MGISSKINVFRRKLTHGLTKNIGKQRVEQNFVLVDKNEIKRVLICRPNARLGNLLLITPLVQEVEQLFPNCKIDLFVKGFLAPAIYKNYNQVSNIIELPKKPFKSLWQYFKVWNSLTTQKYDIAINVDQGSSSGRLATRFANARFKCFGDLSVTTDLHFEQESHIAKYPVLNFREYSAKLGLKNRGEIACLNLKLTSFEIANGRETLQKVLHNSEKTICIFTYATGSKRLSESWWENFYSILKTEYPNYNIIEILPIENVSQIGFKAPAFYSKDIRKIGAVIANADLFIGADSGIMHLASAVNTPTIGLFLVSNMKKYEPYCNDSIGVDVNTFTVKDYLKTIDTILNKSNLKSS